MKKVLCSLLLLCMASIAHATEIVKVVVPNAPGGITGQIAQEWIAELNSRLKNKDIKLILEYRVGAGGQVGLDYVAKSPSNEVVLLVASNQISIQAALINPSWTIGKDLIPLAYAGQSPVIMVTAKPTLNSYADVVNATKQKKLFVAHNGIMSGNWVSVLAFQQGTGLSFDLIGYKGNAPALIDVMGGHVDLALDFYGTSIQNIKGGKLKPLMVIGDKRLPELPNVPAYSELGLGDFPAPVWFGLFHNNTDNTKTLVTIETAINDAKSDGEFIKHMAKLNIHMRKGDFSKYVNYQIAYFKGLNIKLPE